MATRTGSGLPDHPPTAADDVLVLGFGVSGRSCANWLSSKGCRVAVADVSLPQDAGAQTAGDVAFLSGDPQQAWLHGVDVIIPSPGISPISSAYAPLLAAAVSRGIPVMGELDIFGWELGALSASIGYAPKVLAVTGTNGKTTTTLMAQCLTSATPATCEAAGNLGPALLDRLAHALAREALPDLWILELSSFQLALSWSFRADCAVFTNLGPDHLTWHGTYADYAAAKMRIFRSRITYANRDDAELMRHCRRITPARAEDGVLRTFGLGPPEGVGDIGVRTWHGSDWITLAETVDAHASHMRPVLPVAELAHREQHNVANALAAIAMVNSAVPVDGRVASALRDHKLEPYRQSRTASESGVLYVNDSKATNVSATRAALQEFGPRHRVILLVGGDTKGQRMADLLPAIQRWVEVLVVFGASARELADTYASGPVAIKVAADLAAAVRLAHSLAEPGDAVVFSPASASTDVYRDYLARGIEFDRLVANLPGAASDVT